MGSLQRSHFTTITNLLMDRDMKRMSGEEVKLYLYLCRLASRFGQSFFYSDSKIEAEQGFNASELNKARERLIELSYIEHHKGENGNSDYRVLDRSDECKSLWKEASAGRNGR